MPPQIDDLNLLPATVCMRSQRSEPTCKGTSKLNMTPSPPYLLCYRRLRKRDHNCIQMHCCPAVSKMGPHIVQSWPEFVVIFPSPSYTPISCASDGLDHQWAMHSPVDLIAKCCIGLIPQLIYWLPAASMYQCLNHAFHIHNVHWYILFYYLLFIRYSKNKRGSINSVESQDRPVLWAKALFIGTKWCWRLWQARFLLSHLLI